MRLGILAVLGATLAAPEPAPSVAVRGTITQSGSYCGGAAPSEEILRRVHERHPLADKFVVHAGSKITSAPPLATFTTDAEGKFSLSLPAGDYCVARASRGQADGKATPGPKVDEACMDTWRAGCDGWWHVAAKELDGSFDISPPCFGPCYRGPAPP